MEIQAPAKINLFLEVVGKRQDGYHLLRTLMCCIGLYDTLHFEMGAAATTIACDHPGVPADETNLAFRAAMLFNRTLAETTTRSPEHVAIHLTKRIPVGAGLGGGSSDAAAVLKHLNHHYQHPLPLQTLYTLALALGADVPFFIEARPAMATGVGEQLEPYAGLPPAEVVVVYPGFGMSTAEVFKNLNLRLTKCEKHLRYFPFKYGKFDMVRHLRNDLETVAIRQFPEIPAIKKELLNQGSMGALMTGSGSAVFGLFGDKRTGREAADALGRNARWQVFATKLLV
jgi:4-diphosphocytidyl-2-C-methyl-D-erythritol kinase